MIITLKAGSTVGEPLIGFLPGGFCMLLVGIVLTAFARRPFRPQVIRAPPGESPPIDLANPYAATTAASPAQRFNWRALRSHCRYLRIANNVAWSVAVLCLITAAGQAAFRSAFHSVLPFFLLAGTFVGVFVQSIWEIPTRRKTLSFAREAVAARGVPENHIQDSSFIGLSPMPTGDHIGSHSDHVGFLHFGDNECVIHTTESDIVIPRAQVVELKRVRPTGETMAWFGLRVIGVSWQREVEPNPVMLYLIAWGGETAFAIVGATDRLHGQMASWAAGGQA